ncbi:uncharacterized protein STEHIDRAFT_161028 [Stereum hirsutum FP-91666 SS1]|uniref:uncharacterized protein n=1 Tax=Stereum hirsutum (strain FP-91666) TaxID=721885 RepID=UPI0004449842|nr:uncharacterized protein STEHIDRAFT_161028 [Stereum hirsutum FP-91666 SS1]EIM82491.1 hypothetical protein STEHIDRAFT_161028 [Stereum hirsutum FP-91666 SS1]
MPKARKHKIPVTSTIPSTSSSAAIITTTTSRTSTATTITATTSATSLFLNHDIDSNTGSANPQASRTIIRRFHVLLKRKAQLQALQQRNQKQRHRDGGGTETAREMREVEREMESMGGLGVYQRMSSIGQGKDRGGGSERVLIGWLKGMGWKGVGGVKHRLLEVGALKPDNYAACSSWLDVTPIDLRSRHPLIREQDFLEMDAEENEVKWDIVSLSLVVNFVPERKDRGKMLTLAHTMLRPKGLLFLALPLPCVLNSRYTTHESLNTLMQHIGFRQVHERWKPGGKMAYWLYEKVEIEVEPAGSRNRDEDGRGRPRSQLQLPKGDRDLEVGKFAKAEVLRTGSDRNNFAILL